MRPPPSSLFLFLLLSCAACDEVPPTTAPTPTPAVAPVPAPEPTPVVQGNTVVAGPFTVTPVYHAAVMVQLGATVFWLDPSSKAPAQDRPKADVLLITDLHADHLDPEAIAAVSGPSVEVVAPAAVAQQRPGVQHVLANGAAVTVKGVTITAVPMYNLQRGPESGGVFHDKGRGNGYILEADGTRLYFAGDTECTDEMKALKDIDLAFLPMNLPYTMTPQEAADCVAAFRPKMAIPYHYAGSDLTVFSSALASAPGITAQTLEFYPGGLPW